MESKTYFHLGFAMFTTNTILSTLTSFSLLISQQNGRLSMNDFSMNEPKLIVNMSNEEALPRNFRASYNKIPANTSSLGLEELRASGSGQFSAMSLQKIQSTIPAENIIIVDLREESHGFVNGIAVSWFGENDWANKDKSLEEITFDENLRLYNLLEKTILLESKKGEIPSDIVHIHEACTEADLTKSLGVGYIRIPVTDHLKPSNEELDQFIAFIKEQKNNSDSKKNWIHFHCAAGRGRTTTFIALYDMILNSSTVSFEDIIERQALIGGKDLAEPFEKNDWRYEHGIDRLQFLKQFYQYTQANPNLEQSWSSWIAS